MHVSPQERYQQDLKRDNFQFDSAQQDAVDRLQELYKALSLHVKELQKGHWLRSLAPKFFKAPAAPKGLYFWGGVGRGKTYLMDTFYDALPFDEKMRTHFHRFMRRVHRELKELKEQPNPLVLVADKLAREARVICFDEFFVSDITDAMILANLLDALFERGVVLVATSNIEPEGLYKDGLQRARFLPAIDLLLANTDVVNVDGGVDYRLRTLEKTALYHFPLNEEAESQLDQCFIDLIPDGLSVKEDVALDIEGRSIQALKEADDIVWFDFYALCDGPRSQNDYIEIAREYHAVIVEGVPELGAKNDDMAKRFIFLVDEFYDRNVKLILSAAKPIAELYRTGRAEFEFQRTVSRLQEMQSIEYLARPHKP